MTRAEAKQIMALLSAAFPRDPMPDSSVELWSSEIMGYEFDDAREAVKILGMSGRFMASLAELVAMIQDVRNDRLRRMVPTLPAGKPYPFAVFLAEHPDMRARVEALATKRGGPSANPISEALATLIRDEIG